MTHHPSQAALVALLLACLPVLGIASEKPLWELGAGLTTLYFPDYPGSDQSRAYVLPFPYLIYRGDFFKADRDGVRGIFFDSDRVELNMSVGASLPVNSDENRARQGMPDLQPTVEVGPALNISLWRTSDQRYKLDLRLPVWMAITVRGGVEDIGWVFSPRLNLDILDVGGAFRLESGVASRAPVWLRTQP